MYFSGATSACTCVDSLSTYVIIINTRCSSTRFRSDFTPYIVHTFGWNFIDFIPREWHVRKFSVIHSLSSIHHSIHRRTIIHTSHRQTEMCVPLVRLGRPNRLVAEMCIGMITDCVTVLVIAHPRLSACVPMPCPYTAHRLSVCVCVRVREKCSLLYNRRIQSPQPIQLCLSAYRARDIACSPTRKIRVWAMWVSVCACVYVCAGVSHCMPCAARRCPSVCVRVEN